MRIFINEMKSMNIFVAACLFLVVGCSPRPASIVEKVDVDSLEAQCWQEFSTRNGDAVALQKYLDQQVKAFQMTAEEVLVVREKTLSFIGNNKALIVADKPVPPHILNGMKALLKQSLDVSVPLVEVEVRNQCWLAADKLIATNSGIHVGITELLTN